MPKTIPQLTDATTVNAADEIVIQQGGITKRATAGELSAGLNAFSKVANIYDYGSVIDDATITAAIAAAVAGNFVVGVPQSITVKVPTSAATLQIAMDRLTPLNRQVTITLEIQTGHALTAGVLLQDRDCSQFRVTSVDAEVPVSFNGNVFAGNNARMPVLACLINAASQSSGTGVRLEASEMFIAPNCGVKNCWGNGLHALYGSRVSANNTVWSGAARNGVTGSGITSWGSIVSAEGSDCTNSGYYGAQAAHGGLLSFRQGDASNAYRHGIRATDAAIVDADGAKANDCGADLEGRNLQAYEAGIISFVGGEANGNKSTSSGSGAMVAFGAGSAINARLAQSTGNARCGARAEGGGIIRLTSANIAAATVAIEEVDGVISQDIGALSGVYTPTLTNTTNITSSTASEAMWLRVGNFVTVSGSVTITSTAAGNVEMGMSLPIASSIAATRDVGGVAAANQFQAGGVIGIRGDSSNNRASFRTVDAAGQITAYSFHFTYRIR